MIAIALQTAISMILCFAVGFVTAWIVRGGRERRSFEQFFSDWRNRYDQLERDYDGLLGRNAAMQRELSAEREKTSVYDPIGTQGNLSMEPIATSEQSPITSAEGHLNRV
jgi:hypothetical protein